MFNQFRLLVQWLMVIVIIILTQVHFQMLSQPLITISFYSEFLETKSNDNK